MTKNVKSVLLPADGAHSRLESPNSSTTETADSINDCLISAMVSSEDNDRTEQQQIIQMAPKTIAPSADKACSSENLLRMSSQLSAFLERNIPVVEPVNAGKWDENRLAQQREEKNSNFTTFIFLFVPSNQKYFCTECGPHSETRVKFVCDQNSDCSSRFECSCYCCSRNETQGLPIRLIRLWSSTRRRHYQYFFRLRWVGMHTACNVRKIIFYVLCQLHQIKYTARAKQCPNNVPPLVKALWHISMERSRGLMSNISKCSIREMQWKPNESAPALCAISHSILGFLWRQQVSLNTSSNCNQCAIKWASSSDTGKWWSTEKIRIACRWADISSRFSSFSFSNSLTFFLRCTSCKIKKGWSKLIITVSISPNVRIDSVWSACIKND